ncbi:MAG: endo,4-beta-xylanase, partial [Frankiaceae bacterium]|nr:endo,4-beta-xylanase [Frankiaceae bacterium]
QPFGPPSAPLAPAATVAGAVVTVTWQPPAHLFGSTITGYTVRATPGGASCHPVPPTATTCVITGLAAGTSYTFRVIAHSTAGDSAVSVMSQALALEGVPSHVRTGAPLGVLGETGVALIALGAAITAVARRRRVGESD